MQARPTPAQISFLMRLTGIRQHLRIQRYVARRVGKLAPEAGGEPLSRLDFSKVIDAELRERRQAA